MSDEKKNTKYNNEQHATIPEKAISDEKGMVHRTRENALAHAQALLGGKS